MGVKYKNSSSFHVLSRILLISILLTFIYGGCNNGGGGITPPPPPPPSSINKLNVEILDASVDGDRQVKCTFRMVDENGAPLQLVGHGVGAVTTVQVNSPGGHLIAAAATSTPFEMFLGQNTPNDIVIASMFSEVDFGPGEKVFDLGFRVDVNADDLNGVWMDPANHQIPYMVEYVPEPGTIVMLLGALAGLAMLGWRRRRAA